jgi:glycosyltransferase involved in cell wall biosynthesis
MDRTSRGGPAPVLSLIVPVYNVAGYVGACLDSILGQPAPDIEVIVVDDGSTDDSAAIVAERARSEPRIRVITQDNAGLGAARNRAVSSSGSSTATICSRQVLSRSCSTRSCRPAPTW